MTPNDSQTPADGSPSDRTTDSAPSQEPSGRDGPRTDGGDPTMEAARYPDGTLAYPPHPLGPGGREPAELVDLSEHTAEILTWTTSTATPPGVREPNYLAIVQFEVEGKPVRAVGQLTTDEVAIGDEVEPTYVEALRDPEAGIRDPESQEWDGFRFRPI